MTTTMKGEELRSLIARLDGASIEHFQGATNVCVSRSHYEVTGDHLLLRMLDEAAGDVSQVFNAFNVNRASIRRAVQRALDGLPTGHRGKPVLAPQLVELFQSAAVLADDFGLDQIRPGLLLLALALNPGHARAGEFTPELSRIDPDQLRDHFLEIVQGPVPQPGTGPEASAGPEGRGGGTALAQFTIDLTGYG
jgi:type VI secretion system protein VasG